MAESLSLDDQKLRKAALHYRAINNKLRQAILQFIHKAGQTTVTPIYHKLKLEQSVASQHLAILRRAGTVLTKRKGKFIYYTINYDHVNLLHQQAYSLTKGIGATAS